jgi:hypothetical protein
VVRSDQLKFRTAIVLESYEGIETGFEARIGGQKLIHFIGVAGNDYDEPTALVFHPLEENLNGLKPEVILCAGGQRIGFVNEQHSPDGLINEGISLHRCLPNILCDKRLTIALDQMPAFKQS